MIRFLLLSLSLTASSLFAGSPVHEFMLDNGMKLIVKEDHRSPVVVSQIWYKVGSSYEYDGITGASHVLEHMMFKGTHQVGAGKFSRIIAALGGSENAFTGQDYTAYFETLSKDRIEKAFELEADRMTNLLLDNEEFLKELDVVKEERRLRTEDKPTSLTYEQFNAVAYRLSPYRNPIIGWMNDLDQMTIQDMRAWYRRWYTPNNATLVVAGDVEPEQILAMTKQYFGKIPAGPELIVKQPVEPKQEGLTRLEVKVPARQPYLIMGFKAPIIGSADEDWEPYALYMLSAILDGGSSSRFSREIIRRDKIAASAGADYDPYGRLPSMFLLDGTPTDNHSIPDVEKALLQHVETMKTDLVSEEELRRVVTRVISSKVFKQDSVFYQAMEIGMLETIGQSWRLAEEEVPRIRAVTSEQVRAVARKYLNEENLTIAVLKPLPMDQVNQQKKKSATAPKGDRHGT